MLLEAVLPSGLRQPHARLADQTGLRYPPRQQKGLIKMDFLGYRHVPTILLLAALVGCTQQQNSQDLKARPRNDVFSGSRLGSRKRSLFEYPKGLAKLP